RYEMWETNWRYASEEWARFTAKQLSFTPEPSPEFAFWITETSVGQFDILAKRLLIVSIHGPSSVTLYGQCLGRISQFMLTRAMEKCPSFVSKAELASSLKIGLVRQTAHWKAEALALVRESEAKEETPVAEIPQEKIAPVKSSLQDHEENLRNAILKKKAR